MNHYSVFLIWNADHRLEISDCGFCHLLKSLIIIQYLYKNKKKPFKKKGSKKLIFTYPAATAQYIPTAALLCSNLMRYQIFSQ